MSAPETRLPAWADLTGASLPQSAAPEDYNNTPFSYADAEYAPASLDYPPDTVHDEPPQYDALPVPIADSNHAHPTEVALPDQAPTWAMLQERFMLGAISAIADTQHTIEATDPGDNPDFAEAVLEQWGSDWRQKLDADARAALDTRLVIGPPPSSRPEIAAAPQHAPAQALGQRMIEGAAGSGADAALGEPADELER